MIAGSASTNTELYSSHWILSALSIVTIVFVMATRLRFVELNNWSGSPFGDSESFD